MKIKEAIVISTILSSILCAGNSTEKSWSYQIEPYMLIASMNGTAKIGHTPTMEIDVDFGTILDHLDMGAMVHFEAHHQSGWGLWLDYGFMDLSSDINGNRGGLLSTSIRQGILEAYATYKQPLEVGYIEYFSGIRWWDNDLDIEHSAITKSINLKDDWIDPVVGLKWSTTIYEDWKFNIESSIGGFGVGSDLSVGGIVGVSYVINDLLDINLKYKTLWADYEKGTKGRKGYFQYDVTTSGAIIGVNFKF